MGDKRTGARPPAILTGFDGQLLKLSEEKAPYGWDHYSASELAFHPNVGLEIPEPFVAVDIDDAGQAEKLTELVKGENLRCQIMQTTRGRHFWFRAAEPVKNSIKTTIGIGLVADYRSWGKHAQVCVKFKGVWREWLTDYSWEELDELPRWLRPLRQNKWRFDEMGDGDGRNAALYAYQIELSKRGYTQREAKYVLSLINRYIFREPLEDGEFATVSREEAYPETETVITDELPWYDAKGRFLHNVMGDVLISEARVLSYHHQLYVYKDGYYQPGENDILQRMVEKLPTGTKKQQAEVLNYIGIVQHIDDPPIDEYIINVKNGRLDLKTGELMPHTPEAFDFQQVNATYDPRVYYDPLDHMLMRVFCGDYELYKLFEEILGYCLIKNCRMQKLVIFFGEGNNGKSTLLRMLCGFLGAGNYTTLSLQDLETTFRPAELQDKLANLGDDIPATDIRDSSRLKSISSGEALTVERKNQHPFILRNYATLIFTTNKMPRVNDKSFGFYRRLTLVPLDATFSKTDPDYDPDIAQKVVSEGGRTYLLNMAVRGLRRLLKHGFTTSSKVEKALETYKVQSSHTLRWVGEEEISEETLMEKSTSELYFTFRNWCEGDGVKNVPTQRSFVEDLKREFDFVVSEQKREKSTGKRVRYLERCHANRPQKQPKTAMRDT